MSGDGNGSPPIDGFLMTRRARNPEEKVVSTNAPQAEVYEMEIETTRIPRTLLMACAVSLGLHVVVLASLSVIKFAQKLEVFATISSVMDDESEELRPKFDTTMSDQVGNDVVSGSIRLPLHNRRVNGAGEGSAAGNRTIGRIEPASCGAEHRCTSAAVKNECAGNRSQLQERNGTRWRR